MFDAVVTIDVPAQSDYEASTAECPGCSSPFLPKRSNQKYCSRACQKNASRGNRVVENRGRSWRHYERAHRLTEMLYSTPPQERLGVMKDILATIPHDAGFRNILTDPELLMKPPRRDCRTNIAKAANAYTQKFFGLSIKRYVIAIREGREPTGIPLRP